MSKLAWFWFAIYGLILTGYALWSFGMTDPNLVLTSWPPYWQFQQSMWQILFHNRPLQAGLYTFLIFFAVIAWNGLTRSLPQHISLKKIALILAVLSVPLMFSYNALSHDVFNYIFNAKMVTVYHQDPHRQVALNFPNDPWIRFMHNTHTPAPYGYGWTVFSLITFMAGMGKFTLTWFLFRALNVFGLFLLLPLFTMMAKRLDLEISLRDVAAVVLHPLFLIELISNSHNDLWMLIPAMLSLTLIFSHEKKMVGVRGVLSAVLLAFSISTKLATLVFTPLWLLGVWGMIGQSINTKDLPVFVRHWVTTAWMFCRTNIGFIAGILLFIPLFSPRSQFFHPWYLTWVMIWLPFVKIRWWWSWVLSISISSLFRYVPWLLAGGFSDEIVRQQQTITWLGALLSFCIWFIWCRPDKLSDKKP
jgi:hypothetical protein